jgi:cellobiose-specific phosphotransferase system component IIC
VEQKLSSYTTHHGGESKKGICFHFCVVFFWYQLRMSSFIYACCHFVFFFGVRGASVALSIAAAITRSSRATKEREHVVMLSLNAQLLQM